MFSGAFSIQVNFCRLLWYDERFDYIVRNLRSFFLPFFFSDLGFLNGSASGFSPSASIFTLSISSGDASSGVSWSSFSKSSGSISPFSGEALSYSPTLWQLVSSWFTCTCSEFGLCAASAGWDISSYSTPSSKLWHRACSSLLEVFMGCKMCLVKFGSTFSSRRVSLMSPVGNTSRWTRY